MSVFAMDNTIQNYAWGHPTAMAQLQGREPSSKPEAEMWMGTHPSAPSQVLTPQGKRELPEFLREVAPGCDQLPFLMKILTIGGPLSIQVHPNREQAKAGFAADEASGIPISDPTRSYKDAFDKPEVVIALEPMRILAGLLDPQDRQRMVDAGLEWARPLVDASPAELVETVFQLPESDGELALESLPHAQLPQDREEMAAELLEQYPGDRGVLVAMCMNLVHLNAGEALFTDAGVLHAYASGIAAEIMNPSDNVLRAGLTPKHVDVPELARILRTDQSCPLPLDIAATSDGGRRIPLWNDRLVLRRYRGDHQDVQLRGITIALATRGSVRITVEGETYEVPSGHSVLVVGDHDVIIGGGEVYLASCPVPEEK